MELNTPSIRPPTKAGKVDVGDHVGERRRCRRAAAFADPCRLLPRDASGRPLLRDGARLPIFGHVPASASAGANAALLPPSVIDCGMRPAVLAAEDVVQRVYGVVRDLRCFSFDSALERRAAHEMLAHPLTHDPSSGESAAMVGAGAVAARSVS